MSLVYWFLVLCVVVDTAFPNTTNIFNIYSSRYDTDMCKSELVAFSVGRTTGFAPSGNSRILMDHVYYNKEGHFDMSTSEFKAPVDGVYEFSFGATSAPGKPIALNLIVRLNGQSRLVTSTFNYHAGAPSHKQASTVVYVGMRKGEKASLELAGGKAIYGQKSGVTTQFSGHLLK